MWPSLTSHQNNTTTTTMKMKHESSTTTHPSKSMDGNNTKNSSSSSSSCQCCCLVTKLMRKLRRRRSRRAVSSSASRQGSFQCLYDPLSYSLNFDSTGCGSSLLDEDYYKFYAFSSRFVATNPRTSTSSSCPIVQVAPGNEN